MTQMIGSNSRTSTLSFAERRRVSELADYTNPDHPIDGAVPSKEVQSLLDKTRHASFSALVNDLFRRQLI